MVREKADASKRRERQAWGLSGALFVQVSSPTITTSKDDQTLWGNGAATANKRTIDGSMLYPGAVVSIAQRGILTTAANQLLTMKISLLVPPLPPPPPAPSPPAPPPLVTATWLFEKALNNAYWELDVQITFRTSAAAGTVMVNGRFCYAESNIVANGIPPLLRVQPLSGEAPLATNGPLLVDTKVVWGAANNLITFIPSFGTITIT